MTEMTKLNAPSNPRTNQNSKHTSTRPHGKSKFAQKSRSKPNTKPVLKPRGPVNAYTSVCCSLPSTKPAAFSAVAGSKDKSGLGHWRCSGCRKVCKVTVSKFKKAEETPSVEVPIA